MSIHGLVLEVRVTGCRKLRDTEFFSQQDPYVVLEYATTKLRTRTCTEFSSTKCSQKAMNKMGKSAAGSSMHHVPPPMPAPPPALASAVPYSGFQPSYPPASAYPAASAYTAYPTPSPSPYKSPDAPSPQQPRPALGYTTTSYPPQPYEKAYPPQPYGQVYPPSPQPYGQPHPPPSATQSPYPPAPYPGTYQPGPY